jgi:hypothetical protein
MEQGQLNKRAHHPPDQTEEDEEDRNWTTNPSLLRRTIKLLLPLVHQQQHQNDRLRHNPLGR